MSAVRISVIVPAMSLAHPVRYAASATRFLAVLILCLGVTHAWADAGSDRPNGLMWNRTGLPAVFPLHVKTDPGRDYVIVLQDTVDGSHDLAAYARGGTVMRVLVPPGTFTIIVQYGQRWKGDRDGFGHGADAGVMVLPDPLSFRVQGLGTKSGHMIDLRGAIDNPAAEVQIEARAICQTRRRVVDATPQRRDRISFDRAWERQRNAILPSQMTAPRLPLPVYPQFGPPDPLDQRGRELAYLRYQNRHPPFGVPPDNLRLSSRLETRLTPCW